MKIEKYPFVKHPKNHYYEFYSEGPTGRIKKVVEYFKLQDQPVEVFNLSFGDWDDRNHRINDLSVTNNSDRDRILVTVASTVIDFLNYHRNAIIIAAGSTLSRNRLYQMNILKFLTEINAKVEIQGYADGTWQPFKKGINYSAFLVKAKQYL